MYTFFTFPDFYPCSGLNSDLINQIWCNIYETHLLHSDYYRESLWDAKKSHLTNLDAIYDLGISCVSGGDLKMIFVISSPSLMDHFSRH